MNCTYPGGHTSLYQTLRITGTRVIRFRDFLGGLTTFQEQGDLG